MCLLRTCVRCCNISRVARPVDDDTSGGLAGAILTWLRWLGAWADEFIGEEEMSGFWSRSSASVSSVGKEAARASVYRDP